MRGLEALARQAFDRRLLCDSPRPIVVALSGGGDSLALTLIADDWAKAAGRDLLILTVDHGLQTQGAVWTDACAQVAARLGRPFQALAWTDPKPATGLAAAARAARHRLIADAARQAGARVVLMGHTADDILEARAMRAAGATTPEPREWAPSPAWPHGRGMFLLRPLLSARRADLRAWLTDRDQAWIDDPANIDPRSARARARLSATTAPDPDFTPFAPLAVAAKVAHSLGIITLPRAALRAATPDEARRLVALASVCAGGGDRRPAADRIARAAEAFRGQAPVVATLAGARLEGDDQAVRVFREPGEIARHGLRGGPVDVWDGRFEVVRPACRLAGLAKRLPRDQQAALRALPPAARGGLPALVDGDLVSCPALTGEAVSLIPDRFAAAAGLVPREPA